MLTDVRGGVNDNLQRRFQICHIFDHILAPEVWIKHDVLDSYNNDETSRTGEEMIMIIIINRKVTKAQYQKVCSPWCPKSFP